MKKGKWKMAENKISFEAAMTELESIISKMETNEIKLEELVKYYKRATELKEICELKLSSAKDAISKVSEGVLQKDTDNDCAL